ncbi:MAG: hypothetical protein JWN96_3246, partial [Mycobacterium sp.]|nr:hypothetical protein [Mycobacterium sp.]
MRRVHRLIHLVGKSSLILRFALVSAVLVASLGAIAVNWVSGFIRSSNVASARASAKYSVDFTLNQLGVTSLSSPDISPTQYKLTSSILRSMVATGRYAGAVAWLPDGTIAYAAEPGRTGTHEKARPALQAAMHGEMVTAVVTAPLAGVPDPTERRALTKVGSVLEIFAPITIDGKVVASVQLYQPWHTVEET